MTKTNKNVTKIKILVTMVISVIIGCVLMLGNVSASAEEELDILKNQFQSNGLDVERCTYLAEKDVLSVSLVSETTQDFITASDIAALRKSRNTIRYDLGKLRVVSTTATYNEVLKNSVGETLIDSDMNITTLPQFAECSKLLKNIGIENADMSLQDTLSSVSTAQISTEYNYDTSTGNTLIISLDYNGSDYESINKEVANIMHTIDKYNKTNYSVQQVTVNVTNNGNQIIYMEADLVYRDFLWWQLPEMVDRWTLY